MHQNLPLFYTPSIKSKRKKNKDHLWLINPIRREAIKIGSSYANLIFNIIMSKINYKKMIVIYTTNLIIKIEIYI